MFAAEIQSNREVAPRHGLISFLLPRDYPVPMPGQFVMVRVHEGTDPLLNRPFSVYNFHGEKDHAHLDVLYRVVGRGTERMSQLRRGESISLSPPRGTGFHLPADVKRIYLIAGGVGVAPLVYLARFYRNEGWKGEILSFVGVKTKGDGLGLSDLAEFSHHLTFSTEDGTAGFHGMITEAFGLHLPEIILEETAIYACGPRGMVRALAALLSETPVFCQVSLEERMACGLGACLGCVVALKGREGNTYYARVCADGPVFNLRHVIWEEER